MFMKRLALTALVVVWFALPACAQRPSGHGGFAGHMGPAFHAAPSAPVSRGFSGHPGYASSRAPSMPRAAQGAWISRSGARPPYLGSSRYRRPYVSHYRPVFSYGVPLWNAPYFLAYPDGGGDNAATTDNSVPEGYDDQPDQPDDQEPPPWPGTPYAAPPVQSSPAPTSDSEDAVTIIFKDGRPPEQIRNYILTRDTLYVGDRYHRQIPVDQLDLPATVQVNRDLGADFHLPSASR